MTEHEISTKKFSIFIALLILLCSVLLFPLVFQHLFSFGELLRQDVDGLYKTSISFLILAILILVFRNKIGNILFILFSGVFLVFIELGFRFLFIVMGSDDVIKAMNFQSNATYTEFQAYEGNPFTQFLGKGGVEMKGNKALKVKGSFNNFGFVGSNFYYYKPGNVIRVACLGESTTADGYPLKLEQYLNSRMNNKDFRFEVYNFGHGYWTTNHSLANFVLNVLDFSPQIVVIHHGWNEEKVRNVPAESFRGDYSHRFKSFNAPFVIDRYIIRVSGIYRYFKFMFDKSPEWTALSGSIEKKSIRNDDNYSRSKELLPFHRNMKTMADVALDNNIDVFLVTIPYSTNENIPMKEAKPNIQQCNNITRVIHDSYPNKVHLVDLDKYITGLHNEIFVDLAHVTDEGRELKSEYIGNQILQICDSSFLSKISFSDRGYDENSGINYILDRMRNDQNWMENDLMIKAERLNIPLDSVMLMDAMLLIDMDKNPNKNELEN